jgi:hypothetical protein
MKAKINAKNIRAWFEGTYRYFLYYSPTWGWLMRNHIREQIDWRISIMDRDCFNQGSCKLCGCATTALQMANKACDKPCYPTMYNEREWKALGPMMINMEKNNKPMFRLTILKEYVED